MVLPRIFFCYFFNADGQLEMRYHRSLEGVPKMILKGICRSLSVLLTFGGLILSGIPGNAVGFSATGGSGVESANRGKGIELAQGGSSSGFGGLPSHEVLGESYRLDFGPGVSYLGYQEAEEGFVTQVAPSLHLSLFGRDLSHQSVMPAVGLEILGMGMSYGVAGDLPGVLAMSLHLGAGLPLGVLFGSWNSSVIIGYQGRYLGSFQDEGVGYGDMLFPEFYFALQQGPESSQTVILQVQPVIESIDIHFQSIPILARAALYQKELNSNWWYGISVEHFSIERVKGGDYRSFNSNEVAVHIGCEI